MAFRRYTNAVAAAGKDVYPLPAVANAALNRPGLLLGQYPSGGPLPHLFSIWKEGDYSSAKTSAGLPTWHLGRLLNGDESHQGRHLNLPYGEYQNQRITLYKY